MGFIIKCPNCGERDVYEFSHGGEYVVRPPPESDSDSWISYIYERSNEEGVQKEWWYHTYGCGKWFLALRDTRDNTVLKTNFPLE